MIFAIALFLSASGPVGVIAGQAVFRDRAACEQFLVVSTAHFDQQRLVLQAATGAAVVYLAFCHDAGMPA